ncbi:MAG: D-TA family PLP-dependent enzyme [Lachnospiraceae bacterium]|nr:D-TA family PLP-dependent enzyme [Lachnospiraceae bacterium]
MTVQELDTPALLIDQDIMSDNLRFVQEFANRHGVALRPHTKTHKMPEIAKLQVAGGACGIAVAKVGEAEEMAKNGLTDIFIANEIVGRSKWERIRLLAEKISVSFGIDTPCQVTGIEEVFAFSDCPAEVLIEIEVGENRSGIIEESSFFELLDTIKDCPHVHLKGLFSHDGNTYASGDIAECRSISIAAQERTLHFAALARAKGFPCEVISYGATPTIMNDVPILEGITELRLGTYIFMDASQGHAIGTLERCAATVLATVISRPTSERVILDVGAKGLTMQTRTEGICAVPGRGTLLDDPEIHIEKMFDEHAIINDRRFREQISVGDKVRIIPVHICPVCNLYDTAWLISGQQVIKKLPISCRGKLT